MVVCRPNFENVSGTATDAAKVRTSTVLSNETVAVAAENPRRRIASKGNVVDGRERKIGLVSIDIVSPLQTPREESVAQRHAVGGSGEDFEKR